MKHQQRRKERKEIRESRCCSKRLSFPQNRKMLKTNGKLYKWPNIPVIFPFWSCFFGGKHFWRITKIMPGTLRWLDSPNYSSMKVPWRWLLRLIFFFFFFFGLVFFLFSIWCIIGRSRLLLPLLLRRENDRGCIKGRKKKEKLKKAKIFFSDIYNSRRFPFYLRR